MPIAAQPSCERRVAARNTQSMMDKHGIGQIGNGAYRLSANFRFRVGLSQLQKLFDRRGLPAARQNPNCVESAPYSQTLLSQGCSHPRIPISPLTLDRPLGIPPFEMTVGIELRQPVVRLSAGGTRGLTRLVLGPVLRHKRCGKYGPGRAWAVVRRHSRTP